MLSDKRDKMSSQNCSISGVLATCLLWTSKHNRATVCLPGLPGLSGAQPWLSDLLPRPSMDSHWKLPTRPCTERITPFIPVLSFRFVCVWVWVCVRQRGAQQWEPICPSKAVHTGAYTFTQLPASAGFLVLAPFPLAKGGCRFDSELELQSCCFLGAVEPRTGCRMYLTFSDAIEPWEGWSPGWGTGLDIRRPWFNPCFYWALCVTRGWSTLHSF